MNVLNVAYKFARRSLLVGSGILIGASNYEFFDDFRFNVGKELNQTIDEKMLSSPQNKNYRALEELIRLKETQK